MCNSEMDGESDAELVCKIVRMCRHFIFVSDRESYFYPICMKSYGESDRESDTNMYV
jgi:hypothetical protein